MKKWVLATLSLALTVSLAGCQQLDVVAAGSVKSFEAVLNAIPNQVAADDAVGGFSLTAPDGSARFIWSKGFSAEGAYDVMLELDAKPFVDAGLDTTKLPAGMVVEDRIMVGTGLGDDKPVYDGDVTPSKAFEQIVAKNRDHIGYHMAMDHYGVILGGGNLFEWAKDMSKNDMDIVFVLDPQVFIDAGVEPEKVSGWVYAKVPVEEPNGRMVEVYKLLKPFDIL